MPDRIFPEERFTDWSESTRHDQEGHQAQIFTALPGIARKHDVDSGTVHVDAAVKIQRVKSDGTTEWKQIPKLEDVPVQYYGGGGATVTLPIQDGDEGLLVFSSRDSSKWWKEGGVQEQHEARMHSLSDGFFLPGVRSKKRKLDNVSKDTWQLRTDDSKQVVDFDPKNKKIKITSPNPVDIDAPSLRCTGEVIAKYGGDNIHLSTHVHPQQPDAAGDIEKDTDKPKANS